MQFVTKLTANAESVEALRVHTKRKASYDESDVKQKYLKGKTGCNSATICSKVIGVQHQLMTHVHWMTSYCCVIKIDQ